MSNAEIIALIDAVLVLPVSDSTKNDLRSFRSQVQVGTITEDDRNYIIKLCGRLQRSKYESGKPFPLSEVDRDSPEQADWWIAEPSRFVKNIAIACRTLVIAFVGWILVRATWPSEFIGSRLADLTVGGVLSGILWLLISLWIAVMLFAYAFRLPVRRRQVNFWCRFWMTTAVIIVLAYAGALVALQKTPQGFFGNLLWSVSAFMWSLVL